VENFVRIAGGARGIFGVAVGGVEVDGVAFLILLRGAEDECGVGVEGGCAGAILGGRVVFVGGGETGGCGEENAVFRVAVGGSGDVEVGELGVDLVGVAKVRGCGFESGSLVAVWINVCLCGGGGNVCM